jgi:hypothetical protein
MKRIVVLAPKVEKKEILTACCTGVKVKAT